MNLKAVGQLVRYIDLALSLKSETNTISLIVPQNDSPNNKAHERNSRLINICSERDITLADHTDTIYIERKLNESKDYINKSGTTEFAKNVCKSLLQQYWYSADISGDISGIIALGIEKGSTVSGVSNSIPEHNIHHEASQSDSGVSNSIPEHNIHHDASQSDSFCKSSLKSVREDPISSKIKY